MDYSDMKLPLLDAPLPVSKDGPDGKALDALQQAYMAALSMPHSGVRVRNQAALIALRDAIAEETGYSAQEVQDSFESMELQLRMAA